MGGAFSRRNWLDIAVIFVLVFAAHHGIFEPGSISRTDLFLPSDDWLADHGAIPSAWTIEGGGQQAAPYELQQHYLNWLWARLRFTLHVPAEWGRRILWAILPLVWSVFGIYFLSWTLFRDRVASFSATAYFLLNPTRMWAFHGSWLQGTASLGLMPFVIAFYLSTVRDSGSPLSKARGLALAGLTLGIGIWYEMKVPLLALAFLGVYALLRELLTRPRRGASGRILRAAVFLLTIVAIGAAMNAHAILPSTASGTTGVPSSANQPAYINISSENSALASLLLTLKALIARKQVFVPTALLVSLLCIAGIVLKQRDRDVVSLGILWAGLIFLSKGQEPPFGDTFFWLYRHVPGFVAFRDTSKFLFLLTLPASLLVGAAGCEIARKISEYPWSRKFRVTEPGLKTVIAAVILGTITPFLMGPHSIQHDRAGSILVPRPIPQAIRGLYKWASTQEPGTRMLLFPGKSPFSITSVKHPAIYGSYYVSPPLSEIGSYVWISAYGHKSAMRRGLSTRLGEILGFLNVRYVIVYPPEDYMWGVFPGDRYRRIISILQEQKDLRRVVSDKGLAIYEVPEPLPFVSFAEKGILVAGGRSFLLSLGELGIYKERTCLLFASQLKEKALALPSSVSTVVLDGSSWEELLLCTEEQRVKLNLWDKGAYARSGIPTEQRPYDEWDARDRTWLRYFGAYWVEQLGAIPEGPGLVVAGREGANLLMNFKAPADDEYELWLRVGTGNKKDVKEERWELSAHLDYALVAYLDATSVPGEGLRWVRLGRMPLSSGKHTLWLQHRAGISGLDQAAVIPVKSIEAHRERVMRFLSQRSLVFICEAERDSEPASRQVLVEDANASRGRAVRLGYPSQEAREFAFSLSTPLDATWKFLVRCAAIGEGKTPRLRLLLDGKDMETGEFMSPEGNRYGWIACEPLPLPAGEHSVTVAAAGEGETLVDVMLVHTDPDWKPFSEAEEKNKQPSWTMTDPTAVKATMKSPGDRWLVLATNFSPRWYMNTGSKKVEPFVTNGWANGWPLEKEAGTIVNLEFSIQRETRIGHFLSVAATVAACTFALATRRRRSQIAA